MPSHSMSMTEARKLIRANVHAIRFLFAQIESTNDYAKRARLLEAVQFRKEIIQSTRLQSRKLKPLDQSYTNS